MKLHSDTLKDYQIHGALFTASQEDGNPMHLHFDTFRPAGSRTRKFAWDIHLGTFTKDRDATGKMRRKPTNSANQDDLADYTATYSEWGWFIARLFQLDPQLVFGPYKSEQHFHTSTREAFRL